ncbi:MAG: iron ABC transporter permease [Deltaproteobacteria bacterium]|jgi:thiamine transport system permease protein|nr:iron ABC transporter permease [Deltaproteobacteria bacterium]
MKFRIQTWLVLPPLFFLGVFYFYPLISIFLLSFMPEGALDVTRLYKLVSTSYYAGVLWFTIWQAALSTFLTLIVALPGAFLFARYDFKGKALIQNLATIPFVLPTVVTAAAFHALLGPRGLVNLILMRIFHLEAPVLHLDQTVWFFLLAHVFYNYTVILRIVGGFWSRLPKNLTESARMLGASDVKAFVTVTLPLLKPAILAASLLVFVFCFTSFGVVLILGGPRFATVEVEIYRQALHLFNLPMASALALIQIAFTLGLIAVYTRLEQKVAVSLILPGSQNIHQKPQTNKERFFTLATLLGMVVLLGAPLMALFIQSILAEEGPSLIYYTSLLENKSASILYVAPIAAIANSLGYALGATLIALLLGWFSAAFLVGSKGRWSLVLDPVFMLPLSTSAITLGFGFVIALDEPPLNLRASIFLPAIAHAMVAFPFVIRSLLPAWRSIPENLKDAAALLGASPLRIWVTIDWPILRRALLVGAVFAFAVSMGEFGATVFVVRPQVPTMPLAIFRYLSHPGSMNYGQAMAMSCLLMLTTAAGFMLLHKIRPRSGGF